MLLPINCANNDVTPRWAQPFRLTKANRTADFGFCGLAGFPEAFPGVLVAAFFSEAAADYAGVDAVARMPKPLGCFNANDPERIESTGTRDWVCANL